MPKYTLTLFEACEYLNRSKKTITRYIRAGRLHPQRAKSQQGTLEYRFSKEDLNALRDSEATGGDIQTAPRTLGTAPKLLKSGRDKTGQGRGDKTSPEGQGGQYAGIITILKETTQTLKQQLATKDRQIETLNKQVHSLIERGRETNILLKGMQDRLMLTDGTEQTGHPERTEGTKGADKPKDRKRLKAILIIGGIVILTAILILYFH